MLFKVLKRLATKGATEGLAEKIDVFYAAGKLSKKEYDKLIELISKGA